MEKMRISKRIYTQIVLLLALLIASFIITSNFLNIGYNGNGSANGETTSDIDDLLQYEWPQIHGDSAFTRFSTGPAPEASDIMWKTTVKGVESYLTAFNGKVFVTTTTNVIALNKDSGAIVWNTTLPSYQRWPAVFKIDESHLGVKPA